MSDEREPTHWLNYKGDQRQGFDDRRPLGPTEPLREFLWVLDAEYDPETNMTRVGLTKIANPTLIASMVRETDR